MAIEITDATFEEMVLQAKGVVLVDFWAKWCGPCRALAPVIDALSKEYEGSIVIGKLEVDENPEYASKFDIRSIPTLILFKNGEKKEELVGGASRDTIVAMLEKYKE